MNRFTWCGLTLLSLVLFACSGADDRVPFIDNTPPAAAPSGHPMTDDEALAYEMAKMPHGEALDPNWEPNDPYDPYEFAPGEKVFQGGGFDYPKGDGVPGMASTWLNYTTMYSDLDYFVNHPEVTNRWFSNHKERLTVPAISPSYNINTKFYLWSGLSGGPSNTNYSLIQGVIQLRQSGDCAYHGLFPVWNINNYSIESDVAVHCDTPNSVAPGDLIDVTQTFYDDYTCRSTGICSYVLKIKDVTRNYSIISPVLQGMLHKLDTAEPAILEYGGAVPTCAMLPDVAGSNAWEDLIVSNLSLSQLNLTTGAIVDVQDAPYISRFGHEGGIAPFCQYTQSLPNPITISWRRIP